MSDVRERAELNIARAGELLMLCSWLQGQMNDLLIFRERPDLLPDFVAKSGCVPNEVSTLRSVRWEMMFSRVVTDFRTSFDSYLTSQEAADLEALGFFRNALAHAHVSMGRDYLLYRPSGSASKINRMLEVLKLAPVEGQAAPLTIKLTLWKDEQYAVNFTTIKRLDERCFSKIARELGVPHSRIR